MRIKVFQIVPERDKKNVKFVGLDELEKYQGSKDIDAALYEEVFDGNVERDTLEGVYECFNVSHPPLHRGHSMSVSDVVKTEEGFFYCDRIGFKRADFDEPLATKPSDLLRVVYVEPGKPAYTAQLENSLRAMQRAVEGNIEVVCNGDGTLIVCNEEGKLQGLPPNRRVGRGVIVGSFFVAGEAGEDFRSLTEEEARRYEKKFSQADEITEEEVMADSSIKVYTV